MAGDLAFASIAELARLLRTRRVSATELAELFLERLERFGPRYNCLVTGTPERRLAPAARLDRQVSAGDIPRPLDCIPSRLEGPVDGPRDPPHSQATIR